MEDQKNCVAIIGMSLLLPDAASQEEFYLNLKTAKDSVIGPSLDRLIYSGIVPGKDYKPGAYLRRIDQFDYKFFKISKKEAEFMEPTQRLLLELACASIENAGYAIDDFRSSNTAVYLCSNGIFPMAYQANIEAEHKQPDPTIHTGTLNSMICGRISYTLGLTGPAMMIDSGCSSSVVALNEACDKIIAGTIDTALVGGMVLKAGAYEVGRQGHLGAASKSGKSRAFDATADGIGTGEGGGIILVKRLDHAIRDKDNIQAVIKGIGVSQDGGRCNSIAAPSPIAQTNTIRQAWKRAGVEPDSITYIETHGAGTHLGDMIEVQALTDAFGTEYAGKKICALGAVKTNIGHIGNAAGVAGIIKAVISLKKKELFPCLHFKTPNPFIDFDNAPVYVNTEFKPWPKVNGYPLRCGVSSFGLSGTNGHVVLEEYNSPINKEEKENKKGLFLKVAAKSVNAVADYCKIIAAYLDTTTDPVENALYTLNSGRTDYAYRTGFYATDKDQLVQQLNNFNAKDLVQVKQQDKAVVMLFSPGAYSAAVIEKLYTTHDTFKNTFDKVKEASVSFAAGSHAETLAVQLGLHAALLQTGIPVKTVIGNGIGSITTQVISGHITLDEALELIKKEEVPNSPVDDVKLKRLVNDFLGNGHPLFVEVGAANIFYEKMNTWKNDIEGLEVLACVNDNPESVLATFTRIYNYGVSVDWKMYYQEKDYGRVEAPTYPFERTRCWYKDAIDPAESTIKNCLYEHGWQLNNEKTEETPATGKTFLVFTGDTSPGNELITQLERKGNKCITIQLSTQFKQHSDTVYEIDASSEEDYQKVRELITDKVVPGGIIHLNTYAVPYQLTAAHHATWVEKTFIAQYLTAKAFADNLATPGFWYAVLASDAGKVVESDTHIAPLHAMCSVLVKSLMAEYPAIKATWLDLSFGEYAATDVASLFIKEMNHDSLLRFAAIRNDKRYTPVVKQVSVTNTIPANLASDNGVYIVTGGASGIGLEACKAMAGAGKSHFIITGRTDLPPQEEWNRILSEQPGSPGEERIKALQSLQQLGSSVEYHTAEAGDITAMKKMFDAVRRNVSKVTGIIHAAGLGNSGTLIKQRGSKEMRATLSPKITGSILLEELSRDLSPEFFISFSSIAVLVPSRGSADYSSANAFEDAWAHAMRLNNKRFIAINWSDWKETGLAYRKRIQKAEGVVEEREKVVKGLTNKEGILAIRYAIALDKPQLAVVNTDMTSFAINPFFTIGSTEETNVTAIPETTTNEEQAATDADKIKELNKGSLSDVQAKLMLIWHETLKLDTVSLDDDFYDLGGHSLNITQMLNKVKKVFGVSLEMDEMFYNSTIRLLAARIEEHIAKGSVEEYEKIVPLAEQPYYDISHAQKRFWILSQQTGSEAYNVPAAYMFTGNVDIKALENAFRQIIERHESLRTSFVLVDGKPKQQVHPMSSFEFNLTCEDVTTLTGDPLAIQRLLHQEAAIAFNLERPPLLRLKLFRIAANRYLFFMNMHHIVADATSIAVIRNEALLLYKAITKNQEVKLEDLAIQYKDFAAWQNGQLQGDKLAKYKNYWQSRLQDNASPVSLPADYTNKDKKSGQSAKRRIMIEAENFQALKKIAEKNNTSLFTITLALFKVLLHKYTGMTDLVIGTPVNGREHNDLEKQVGIYLNTLLLRTTINETDGFTELLSQVRENTWKDLAHQLYPYDLLREELGQPHFNIGFTWTVREEVKEASDLEFEIEEVPTGFSMAKNDLWLFGVEFKENLVIEFMYRLSSFKKETIDLVAERMNTLIAQVVENPLQSIRELHIKTAMELTMEQQHEVIEFNF
jgi:acyl transferase domain-containing protein/acyl carrier protein